MKQKVVIKVSSLGDQKSRTKAIKTAVGLDGVIQATLQQEKNQIEVTGEDMDVVLLATQLRKSLKFAEVVSVSPVKEEGKKKEEEKKQDEAIAKLVWPPYGAPASYYYVAEPGYVSYGQPQYQDPSCSIM